MISHRISQRRLCVVRTAGCVRYWWWEERKISFKIILFYRIIAVKGE
uniref:Uncharacterized protein n=1 Tax=virus sp. ctah610 TaxID=2826807 RepID=A0A8S5R7I8_9VIRU|nr:MAG TPA: hypothetical protein [virus sp. ctah610]